MQELLDTISSLKSNQDVILKTVATLQTQITTQEHRQTEFELHTTLAQLDAEKTKSDFQLQLQQMEAKRQEREKRLEIKFRENEQKFIKLQQLQDDLSDKMDEEEFKKKQTVSIITMYSTPNSKIRSQYVNMYTTLSIRYIHICTYLYIIIRKYCRWVMFVACNTFSFNSHDTIPGGGGLLHL